jgi:hypothetical protein
MKIRLPSVEFPSQGGTLSTRPQSLRCARVALVDGCGQSIPDGTVGIYPTMEELANLLREREGIASVTWMHKESVSRMETPESIESLAKQFDVVINGEGL